MFVQYIFSRISRRALDARKFDVSETYYHNGTNRISCYGRENLAARICILMLGARKFSCAKIYAFTVWIFTRYIFSYILHTHKGQYPPGDA